MLKVLILRLKLILLDLKMCSKAFILSSVRIFLLSMSHFVCRRDPRSLHFCQSGSLFSGNLGFMFTIQSSSNHIIWLFLFSVNSFIVGVGGGGGGGLGIWYFSVLSIFTERL